MTIQPLDDWRLCSEKNEKVIVQCAHSNSLAMTACYVRSCLRFRFRSCLSSFVSAHKWVRTKHLLHAVQRVLYRSAVRVSWRELSEMDGGQAGEVFLGGDVHRIELLLSRMLNVSCPIRMECEREIQWLTTKHTLSALQNVWMSECMDCIGLQTAVTALCAQCFLPSIYSSNALPMQSNGRQETSRSN